MSAGLDRCAVPTSIHCDHLIQASEGASADLKVNENLEDEIDHLQSTEINCYEPRGF